MLFRSRTVIDRDDGQDAGLLEAFVSEDQVADTRVGVGEMIQPDRVARPVLEAGHCRDGDAVMLIVVGHEREHAIAVNDFGLQHGGLPIDHRLKLLGGEHGVGEFRGHDAAAPITLTC